jgi:hypothetical protein
MTTRIDLLLSANKRRTPRRLGDIGHGAPYVHLSCSEDSAVLPMAVNITSGNSILWEQKDFTADSIRGAGLLAAARGTGGLSNLSFDEGVGFAGAAGMAVFEGIKKDTASRVGSSVGGIDGLGDYILHKQGRAVNPNKELTFNGIAYRSFQMEFELIPLNAKEAANIKEFIEFFQTQAMPDFADGGSTYFSYPSTWDISFGNATWLPKILPAYLVDYSINYGGAGKMVSHRDSSVQTNINLTFTESQLHTRSKVLEGYSG